MNPTTVSPPVELTRQQLYEKVWATPASTLAQEFGVSDVALSKTCKRLGIPRPNRGYWARLAAGQKLGRPPLPRWKDDQPATVQFDVAANRARRAGWAPPPRLENDSAPELLMSESSDEWHRIAQKLVKAMEKSTPGKDGRVEVKRKDMPQVNASKDQGVRIGAALDALVRLLEGQSIKLVEGEDSWNPELRFAKGQDWLAITIEERTTMLDPTPTMEDKRRPSWTWEKTTELTGRLTFRLDSNRRLRGRREWTESGAKPLSELLATVAVRMIELYACFEQERIAEEQAAKDRAEQARRWEQERRLEEHRENLDRIAMSRAKDLMRASEWWQIHNKVLTFISECEARWCDAAGADLTKEQTQWLSWAREVADCLCPFSAGYPVPACDGSFDAKGVKLGGPYPKARNLPDPPSMQTHVSQQGRGFGYESEGPRAPYPFWLKHQRR